MPQNLPSPLTPGDVAGIRLSEIRATLEISLETSRVEWARDLDALGTAERTYFATRTPIALREWLIAGAVASVASIHYEAMLKAYVAHELTDHRERV